MRFIDLLFAILVAAVWGSNFVSVKIGMEQLGPLLITALRFALVAAILLPVVKIPSFSMRSIIGLSITLGVHFWLVFGGMNMGLNVASVILGTQMSVPFACLLGTVFFGDRLGPWRSGGMALAFIGLMILAGAPDIASHQFAFGVVVAGAFAWAVSNVIMKRMGEVEILPLLAVMSLACAFELGLLTVLVEGNPIPQILALRWQTLASILFTTVASTIIGYGLWYYLLKRYPISLIAPFQLLVPVFGIAVSQWFYREPLTLQLFIGGIITLAGVAVIVFRKPKVMEAGTGE